MKMSIINLKILNQKLRHHTLIGFYYDVIYGWFSQI